MSSPIRMYTEDEIFAAGWTRTAGGALFFNKAQGRTLLSDEALPRGWAYSKASMKDGGAKVYENLVTGECCKEPPSSDRAVPRSSRYARSMVVISSASEAAE